MSDVSSSAQEQQAALPVLDLRELEQPTQRADFIARLGRAARDVGFFYLKGHGIEPERLVRLEAVAKRFFALPQHEKDAIRMANSPHFRGYTATGHEITRHHPDRREQIDIGAELPALERRAGAPAWERMQGPNQWPESLPELRDEALAWSASLREIAITLLRAFAEALEQPPHALDGLIDGAPAQLLKLIRYPGTSDEQQRQGVGAHKDAGILTLLHQDHHGGLQVERPEGWIDAPPIEGTFVINIGEILELATNGYLRATNHRVITPPEGVVRYSIAYFLSPSLEGNVPLLPLPPHLAKLAQGPESDPENPLFREIGPNAIKGRLRSHPDVAQRHYGDIG
ncbi:isopenicillin N synthase family dioxygenase [Carnimonas bestiolae]|uniref:isopenicillin N synthase family dioxygenase n=1 Tax=Carnimonas bestiolae TaxID=3402172 RepID=UPI003EDBA1EE